MIGVTGLSVRLGGRAVLADVDLSLRPGTITGLVGESGSGKSMTALAAIGLLPEGARTSGRVDLDGQNLLELPARAMDDLRGRRIGMIFQEPMTALNPLMTIGDQVAEGLRRHRRLGRTEALARGRGGRQCARLLRRHQHRQSLAR